MVTRRDAAVFILGGLCTVASGYAWLAYAAVVNRLDQIEWFLSRGGQ